MSIACGIVGLPNVGKSTIFNALTDAGAEAANYPFCTIEPNVGTVPLHDIRLEKLSEISKSEKTIQTAVRFVDIAGLVKGASTGEGLGNQFLSHIRAVDAIVHVVRCFESEDIVHVSGQVKPLYDIDVINTELILSDLQSVENRLDKAKKGARSGSAEAKEFLSLLELFQETLESGAPLRSLDDPEGKIRELDFITNKPVLYLANVSEEDLRSGESAKLKEVRELAEKEAVPICVLSGQVEAELVGLDEADRTLFLEELGQVESGLQRLAHAGHNLLNLITFFTSGPKESRAWTCERGSFAPQAAGKIHTDFEKGFIRAEVISFEDFVNCGGELGAKDKGLLRVEGKDYVVQDGDVMHFRFNV